jgi:hypothetical protein
VSELDRIGLNCEWLIIFRAISLIGCVSPV